MLFTRSRLAGVGLLAVLALSGCATTPRGPGYVYYRVPCTTPGSIAAEPIAPVTRSPSPPATPTEGGVTAAPTCLLVLSPAVASRGYYPAGYYGQPYFGTFGYGSAFVGLGHRSIGHGSRGHHRMSGGHHNSGHGSGHH
ncbi:hypothetical protein NOLU111490_14070 [Novosphingobium lubricantis]